MSAVRFVTCSALLLLAACSTLPRATSFAGSYAGSAIHDLNPYGESLVEGLDITEQAGTYSLSGFMNVTNREPGMDHTSNTRSQWTGVGTARGDALVFTYSNPAGELGTGALRQERAGLILTFGGQDYRLHRSRH